MAFFDRSWSELGTKWSLRQEIIETTRISEEHLWNPTGASVAARMSWASRRKTSLPEDRAYSLMGLLDVNMPLIYGEGHRAFQRLQEQIIMSTADESIFAWESKSYEVYPIFALSPDGFERSGDVVPLQSRCVERAPYSMTNRSLTIEVECFTKPLDRSNSFPRAQQEKYRLLRLNWSRRSDPEHCIAIHLFDSGGYGIRADSDLHAASKSPSEGLQTVYILQPPISILDCLAGPKDQHPFSVQFRPSFERRFQSTFMSTKGCISMDALSRRLDFRRIDYNTVLIEEPRELFLICKDTDNNPEALGVVILPHFEVLHVHVFVIADFAKASGILQQRTMNMTCQSVICSRMPMRDKYVESLPSGGKVVVSLRRACTEDRIHNLVVLNLE